MISDFRSCLNSILDLLGRYVAYSDSYRRFGKTCRSHLQGSSSSRLLKVAPIDCIEKQVTNYHFKLPKIPEERRSRNTLQPTSFKRQKHIMQQSVAVHWGIGVNWSMGVSVLSVTYVLNIKAEGILMYAYRCTLTARQRMRIVNCEGDADIADTDKCRWKIIPTVFYGFSRKNSFE